MFAKTIDMSKTSIVRIGTSHGVIIPASLLKEVGFHFRDSVEITQDQGRIIISPVREAETITEPFTGPFAALRAIRSLPGDDIRMEDLRRNRHNKTEVKW